MSSRQPKLLSRLFASLLLPTEKIASIFVHGSGSWAGFVRRVVGKRNVYAGSFRTIQPFKFVLVKSTIV
jgi:hypothetical protein